MIDFINEDMKALRYDFPESDYEGGVVLDFKNPYISDDIYTVIAYEDSFDIIARNGEYIPTIHKRNS